MASETLSYVANLHERLQTLRFLSPVNIIELCASITDLQTRLPQDYLAELQYNERVICLRASVICWSVTGGTQVPRKMQLRAILADQLGHDSLISAGTGSGKTLPIAINILLDDPSKNLVTLTISPLKRLQASQEHDFNTRYGIRTFAINEDTPRDEAWWAKNIYSSKGPLKMPAQHLIVTVEQLFKTAEGHMPPIGELIRKHVFQKLISRINIDEVHSFRTAGFALYGLPAFRPAWGHLAELKVVLPQSINWQMFSATIPQHILTHITEKLLKPQFDYIFQTSNRPNIMYATHQVPDKLDNVRNYECFLSAPFNLQDQPHILIFVDDKALCAKIMNHLDSCLPATYRGKGVVKHYHSAMSKLYLEQTHADFVSPTGICRILVTTSGQSVGVDFPNVKIVCTVGLPSTIVDALQRGGRAIRIGNEPALFVVFYESWALKIKESEYQEGTDPDRPRTNLTPNSRAQERAPLSAVQLVQCRRCLRRFYANYLNDHSEIALDYTGPFCCDRHEDGFVLQDFLPGKLFLEAPKVETTKGAAKQPDIVATENQTAENEATSVTEKQTTTRKGKKAKPKAVPREVQAPKYRSRPERLLLEPKVISWLDVQVANDPCKRPAYEILSVEQMKTLIRMLAKDVTCASAITRALDEAEEWAEEWSEDLYRLVSEFDTGLRAEKTRRTAAKQNTTRAKRAGSPHVGGFVVCTAESYRQGLDVIDAESSRSRKRQKKA